MRPSKSWSSLCSLALWGLASSPSITAFVEQQPSLQLAQSPPGDSPADLSWSQLTDLLSTCPSSTYVLGTLKTRAITVPEGEPAPLVVGSPVDDSELLKLLAAAGRGSARTAHVGLDATAQEAVRNGQLSRIQKQLEDSCGAKSLVVDPKSQYPESGVQGTRSQ